MQRIRSGHDIMLLVKLRVERFWIGTIVAVVLVAVLLLPETNSVAQVPQAIPYSFADIAEKVQPCVVNISTAQIITPIIKPGQDFQGDEFFERFSGENAPTHRFQRRSLGSGVILDQHGYIITNNHVIEHADQINVKLSNEQEFKAELIGRDVKTDIALIKIPVDQQEIPVANLGDSDSMRVGDWVIAVGNPYGLTHTVTAGIISAKGRVIGGPYDEFLQTDASINPGNSGGPLINIKGEIIGINTAIFTNVQGNYMAQGIGFAIPSNLILRIVHDLQLYGKVRRGWVGIVIQEVTPEIAESLNLPDARGALVSNIVPGGPAEEAGVIRGDVVLSFNGIDIQHSIDLPKIAAECEPGARGTLIVNRDGAQMTIHLTLGEFPEPEGFPAPTE